MSRRVIKSCPFCGGDADLIECPEPSNAGGVAVECQKCHASSPVVFGVKDDPNQHAIESWNSRVPTEAFTALERIEIIQKNCLCIVPPNQEANEWTIYARFDGEFGYQDEIGSGPTLMDALEMAAAVVEDCDE